MKNLFIYLMIAFIAMACNQKEDHLTNDSSESIFQLNSEWENQEGEFIKLSDLKGNTLVMVMIYTSCKTACPRLTGEMREIEKKLGNYNENKIKLVLVSIDPKVDTPETMKKYLNDNDFNGDQWLFLRSDEASTREFANVLSVKYKQISPIDFSHSNIISVFSDQGVLTYQKEGLSVDTSEVVNEINKLLNNS